MAKKTQNGPTLEWLKCRADVSSRCPYNEGCDFSYVPGCRCHEENMKADNPSGLTATSPYTGEACKEGKA